MGTFWIKGVDLDNPDDGLSIDRAIGKMIDEVTAAHMMISRGKTRELSMVITRLEEARLWAIAYGESAGTHTVVPRAEILRDALKGAN